jgi:hypothetical protein
LFLNLFQYLKRLLSSKHLILFSTYFVGRNGTMWKTCIAAPQNAKKNQLKHKYEVRNRRFYWQLGLRVWRIILVITWWAHKRETFILISIKLMIIWKYLFTCNRVILPKDVVSNLHVCSNGLGKIWPSYTFNFSKGFLTSTHKKGFNIFFA